MWQRILLLFASLIVTAACTPFQPEATQPTPTTSPTPTLEPTSEPAKPKITKTPEPEPTPTPVKPVFVPTPEVTKTPEPKPEPTQPPQVNPDAPVRKPVSGSCDCPYDTDRRGRSCGKRSAYSRPGGRSPICYVRDQQ